MRLPRLAAVLVASLGVGLLPGLAPSFAPGLAANLGAGPALADFSDAERAAIRAEVRGFLLENPDILREMLALLETSEREGQAGSDREMIAAEAGRLFDDGFSHVGGNPEGSFVLVEFVDYECGFCRRAHPDVQALIDGDGDIRLITKEFPILGPGSDLAARAAIATLMTEGGDAYEWLGDALMTSGGRVTEASLEDTLEDLGLDAARIRAAMADEEVTRRIAETRSLAQALGIAGTPTFVFGDRMVRGYLPLADMQSLVDEIRGEG